MKERMNKQKKERKEKEINLRKLNTFLKQIVNITENILDLHKKLWQIL